MNNELEQVVPSGAVRGLIFDILSETDAEKISAKVIEKATEVTESELGLPNLSNECTTCGAKDVKFCEGHFGLINFPYTILNPYYISEVVHILNKICPGCKSVRRSKIKSGEANVRPRNCKYCNGTPGARYPTMKFKVSSRDMFAKTAVTVETHMGLKTLPSDYWDIFPKDPQQVEYSSASNKKILSHAQVYSILKDVDPNCLEVLLKRKVPIFLNSVLVTPNRHRVNEFGQNICFDKITSMYRKLIDFRGTANELSARVLDRIKVSKIRTEKSSTIDSAASASGLKYIKENLLGKRTDYAVRMVVGGDPKIYLGEIGVPRLLAERLRIRDHLTLWNQEKLQNHCELLLWQNGEVCVHRRGRRIFVKAMDDFQIGDSISRPLADGDIVLINRPPSIHQHSLIALSVKILPTSSVFSINPLICSPLRGDFDGDCLHVYIPQSLDCRVELSQLVALDKQLLNGQSGRNLLSLTHDSLTAANLLLGNDVFLSKIEMQQLQMLCPRQMLLPAITKTTSSHNCLWTGKQLFSMLLPSDFDYHSRVDGVHVSRGELLSATGGSSWLCDSEGSIWQSLVKHCQGEALDILHAAQEVLCEWLSTRGLSVSISDLYLSPDPCSRKNMIDEVTCGLREAERLSLIKLLMVDQNRHFLVGQPEKSYDSLDFETDLLSVEQQKSSVLSQASISAFKQVFRDIQNLVYQHASRDNSFLVMLKAGSKGNLLKLVQHCMCLGLQHTAGPLSFRIPSQLSCAGLNNQKTTPPLQAGHNIADSTESYIPCATVENSFLTGLNPLECFLHSVTSRDSSFGGHADVSGSLTRKIMFFMRDLYIAYDGTVRNAYGKQLVQFSYNTNDNTTHGACTMEAATGSAAASSLTGGHPVGSLAACAISEAAYSALDQPIGALESSPLLSLKKVLECGVRKSSGDKTASLFLSKKLGRWAHGFEYGALQVKCHLERVLLSAVVSSVTICFSKHKPGGSHSNPWVSHFHISKEIFKRRRLNLPSVIDALNSNWNSARKKSKNKLPLLQIISKGCSEADMWNRSDANFCITVSIKESMNSLEQLEYLRQRVIPLLLDTVIKGSSLIKQVDILWKDLSNSSRYTRCSQGELYLRVFMSENCDRAKFWNAVVNSCLQIWNVIDWQRSHPDDIHDITQAYGIDVAWTCFQSNLNLATRDIGKSILQEHLVLVTDALSHTGEFVALNPKGLSVQRKEASVSSPFVQACFSNPGDSFLKAAKMGMEDDLQGSLDALSWGRTPSIGSGFQFDIIYSAKGYEPAKPLDVYNLLQSHASSCNDNPSEIPKVQNGVSKKLFAQHLWDYDRAPKIPNSFSRKMSLKDLITVDDVRKLSHALKSILNKYKDNSKLSELDMSTVKLALKLHPHHREKIGSGTLDIKVGSHPKFQNSRCFLVERADGTVEDFSYHKCVHHALELIAPQRAENYRSRWLNKSAKSSQPK